MARGSGLRLVARRALSEPAPVVSVAVNVLVVCTLVAGLAASLSLLQRDALRSALTLAPPEETVLTASSPYDDDDPAAQDAALRAALAPVVEVAGGDVVGLTESATYDVEGLDLEDGAVLASVSGAARWVDGEQGTLPTAAPGPLEVAVPAGTEAAPGDRLVLLSRTDERRVVAVVSGTWRPADDSERWLGPLDPGALLVSPDRFAEVAGTGTQARWRAVPDVDALQPDELGRLSASVATTVAEADAAGEEISASVRTESGLVEVLADRARELTVLRALLLVPAGLLLLVAAAGLLLVGAGLADVRRGEESLLRSRGAGYRQLAAPTVVETLLVCGATALVAPLLATVVVRFGDVRPPLDVSAWVGSAIAAGACALALVVPVVVRAVTGDRGHQLAVERQQRRTLTVLATALLLVVGVGVLALVTLRGFGDSVEQASVRSTSVDPLLVASPALVLLALAAVLSVLALPPVFRVLAAAASSRGVPLAVGTRFASGAPARAVPVALATTLAVGTLAFAAVQGASSAAAREDRASYAVGPDVRISAPASAVRAGAETEEQQLRALPGVREVHAVHRSTVFLEDLPAEVLVTDVGPREALFGSEAADVDVGPLVAEGAEGVVPVALSEQLADVASLRVGDEFSLTLLGVPTEARLVATVPYVRSVADGRGAVLADAGVALPVLAADGFTDDPTEWWLDVEGDPAAVVDALAGRPEIASDVLTRARVEQRLDDDPSTGGSALGRVLLLTGGGCLVVGALLLSSAVLLRRRERAAQAWMLGTAGADRRDVRGVLGWEYAVVTGAGVVAGVLAGTVVAAVTLVSMTLGPDGQLLVPAPQLVLPWPLLVGAPLLMAVVPLLGMLALVRRDHARMLDLDEPAGAAR